MNQMTTKKNKTRPTNLSVAKFLSDIEDDQKRLDAFRIYELFKEVSNENGIMWGDSIIGFGQYHYVYESGREGDFMKLGFSPRKQNISVYIMPGFHKFTDELSRLGKIKTGKSCLYIKKLEDIDFEIFKNLVVKSYNYMTEKYG